jgi:hypothetical protein
MKNILILISLSIITLSGCKKKNEENEETSPKKVTKTPPAVMKTAKKTPAAKQVKNSVVPKTIAGNIEFKELFGGMIYMIVSTPGVSTSSGTTKKRSVYLITSEKLFKSHISRVPKNFISKGTGKPNTDPILKNPKFDFTKNMLIVVEYDYMWTQPKILQVVLRDGKLMVKVKFAENPTIKQHANGVASYVAITIPKSDHKVQLLPEK